MMEIVADEPVRDRRLRGDGFHRRMGIDDAGRGVEARVRDAPNADAPLLFGVTFFTSQSTVSYVSVLSSMSFGPFGLTVRPHVHELAFGHPAAAHVLVHEDDPRALNFSEGPSSFRIVIDSVRRDACTACASAESDKTAEVSFGTYTAVNRRTPSRIGIWYSYLV